MKRAWVWLLLAACTTAVTTTTATTSTSTVELIPSSTVTAAATTTAPPVTTSGPVVTVVTVPPLVTAVPTTSPPTTRPPTVPTSPVITLAPDLPVIYSAPSEALLTASTDLVRTSVGLPALIPHADLDFYARVWAGHLSVTGELGHSNIATLLGPWLIVGENVAAGSDMGQVAAALAASANHYQTMVDPAFVHTGVGVAVDPSGKLWVCQIFGGTSLSG